MTNQVRSKLEEAELIVNKYIKYPHLFMENVLGVSLWDKQIDILNSVRDNQYSVVQSCFGSGKSYSASAIVLWYLYCFPPAKIITTSSSWNQLEKILWSEIASIYNNTKIDLGGKLYATDIKIQDDWFATGINPMINVDGEATRFEGFHSPNVFVLIDQAQGVKHQLWEVAKALIMNSSHRLLALGNPIQKSGDFFNACSNSKLWNKIIISAYDTPNVKTGKDLIKGLVTKKWIEDRIEDWGKDNPLFISKVLGQFPEQTEDTLILLSWVDNAVMNLIELDGRETKGLGVDVARYGRDCTTFIATAGGKVIDKLSYNGKDLMKTAGNVILFMERHKIPAQCVCIDDTGLGGGVTDRLHEQGHKVTPVNNGSKSEDPARFFNLGSQLYWEMRERFATGQMDIPDDDFLKAQLTGRKYDPTSKGQIKIESKDDMKKRGLKSPDEADSLALSLYGQKFHNVLDDGAMLTIIG